MLMVGCVHVCRKAISRSGLQHLGPPQPSLAPASNGPNKELRSCLDWTVRIGLRLQPSSKDWSQASAGARTSLPLLSVLPLSTSRPTGGDDHFTLVKEGNWKMHLPQQTIGSQLTQLIKQVGQDRGDQKSGDTFR